MYRSEKEQLEAMYGDSTPTQKANNYNAARAIVCPECRIGLWCIGNDQWHCTKCHKTYKLSEV